MPTDVKHESSLLCRFKFFVPFDGEHGHAHLKSSSCCHRILCINGSWMLSWHSHGVPLWQSPLAMQGRNGHSCPMTLLSLGQTTSCSSLFEQGSTVFRDEVRTSAAIFCQFPTQNLQLSSMNNGKKSCAQIGTFSQAHSLLPLCDSGCQASSATTFNRKLTPVPHGGVL